MANRAAEEANRVDNRKWSTWQQRIFGKTRMCQFHAKGVCRYNEECSYAHNRDELMARPDLYKTRLCSAFAAGSCHKHEGCPFAHGPSELRILQTMPSEAESSPQQPQQQAQSSTSKRDKLQANDNDGVCQASVAPVNSNSFAEEDGVQKNRLASQPEKDQTTAGSPLSCWSFNTSEPDKEPPPLESLNVSAQPAPAPDRSIWAAPQGSLDADLNFGASPSFASSMLKGSWLSVPCDYNPTVGGYDAPKKGVDDRGAATSQNRSAGYNGHYSQATPYNENPADWTNGGQSKDNNIMDLLSPNGHPGHQALYSNGHQGQQVKNIMDWFTLNGGHGNQRSHSIQTNGHNGGEQAPAAPVKDIMDWFTPTNASNNGHMQPGSFRNGHKNGQMNGQSTSPVKDIMDFFPQSPNGTQALDAQAKEHVPTGENGSIGDQRFLTDMLNCALDRDVNGADVNGWHDSFHGRPQQAGVWQ